MATTIDELVVGLSLDASKFSRGFKTAATDASKSTKRLESSVKTSGRSISSSFASMGGAAKLALGAGLVGLAAGAGAALLGVAKSSVTMASDFTSAMPAT